MSTNWNEVAPIPFMYDRNDTISEALREFYLGSLDELITNNSLPGLGRVRIYYRAFYQKFIEDNKKILVLVVC